MLIFVEVKARATLDSVAESATERQKQRIARRRKSGSPNDPNAGIRDTRFDAILVAPGKLPRHIPAASESA